MNDSLEALPPVPYTPEVLDLINAYPKTQYELGYD